MAKVISIIQNKGGVGKSTITSHLASAMSRRYPDKRVLILDTDPQGNQAVSFGIKPRSIENTIYDILVNDLSASETIMSLSDNLDLIPANADMNFFEIDTLHTIEKMGFKKYLLKLKEMIDPLRDRYDYIFVDSPPELKIVALQILMLADDVYIPFESDAYNAEGLMSLIEKIEENKKQYNISPAVKGLILNKVQKRTVLHRGVSVQVDAYCLKHGIPIMRNTIPFSTVYPKSIAVAGVPITWANPNSDHAKHYYKLLDEVLQNG